MLRRGTAYFVFAFTSCLSVQAAGAPVLDVVRGSSDVTVQVAPGARVILIGVARIPAGHVARVVRRHAVIEDSDRDGRVTWGFEVPVPLKSVWCAVDLDTGEYAIAAPEDLRLVTTELHPSAVHRAQGRADELHLTRAGVDVLVVRPKKGAWVGKAMDGGIGDVDRRNDGRLRALFENLQNAIDRAGGAKDLTTLIPGDIVVVVDYNELDAFATRIGPEARP